MILLQKLIINQIVNSGINSMNLILLKDYNFIFKVVENSEIVSFFAILLIFSPLINFLILNFCLFFFNISFTKIKNYSFALIFFSCYLSVLFFIRNGIFCKDVINVNLTNWINCGFLNVSWSIYVDSLSIIMFFIITFVSLLVHIYSCSYMKDDSNVIKFVSYLSLFTFFMLVLVSADNFIQLFFGWEGVGICSYLLINFWYTRIQANKSAIKALVVNKIGDFFLIVGISLIYLIFKSVNYSVVFSLVPYFYDVKFLIFNCELDVITVICLFLFLGAVGKSAQIGLHTWLPDAMEGPTPVSALIHAATMVTAGVFLIIRCSVLFEYAPKILILMTLVGAVTAFFGATVGLVQNDIKKIIAYSTCSQLGYMMFICGLSHYTVSLFHLVNHAFFKALLFLGAGSVIHALNGEQDIRKMGGLVQLLPFTYIMMLIGTLSLTGFPFLSGFYSKDLILEIAYTKYTISGTFAFWLGTISAFFTSYYSWRLMYYTFLSKPNGYKNVILNAHEGDFYLLFPLAVLAIGSIFSGYLLKDLFVGLGSDFFLNSIFIHPYNFILIEAEFVPQMVKVIPLLCSLLGWFMALVLNHYFASVLIELKLNTNLGKSIYIFLSKKWFFDKIYNRYIVKNILVVSYQYMFKSLDKGLIEFLGPRGITKLFLILSRKISNLHSNFVYDYSFLMFIMYFIFIIIVIILNIEIIN